MIVKLDWNTARQLMLKIRENALDESALDNNQLYQLKLFEEGGYFTKDESGYTLTEKGERLFALSGKKAWKFVEQAMKVNGGGLPEDLIWDVLRVSQPL